MNSRSSISLFILGSLFILACNGQIKNDNASLNSTDSIRREIPMDFRNGSLSEVFEKVQKRLQLPMLKEGVDGFEMRIWKGLPFSDSVAFIRLIRDSLVWSAWVGYFMDREQDTLPITLLKMKPIHDRQRLDDSIFKSNLLTLPHYRDIINYEVPMDADMVTIEYATDSSYRLFSYVDPELNADSISSAKKIVNFLELIESECNCVLLYRDRNIRK